LVLASLWRLTGWLPWGAIPILGGGPLTAGAVTPHAMVVDAH
jgi:hypothetical protein